MSSSVTLKIWRINEMSMFISLKFKIFNSGFSNKVMCKFLLPQTCEVNYQNWKGRYLPHYWSDKGFKSTFVNWVWRVTNITIIVPYNMKTTNLNWSAEIETIVQQEGRGLMSRQQWVWNLNLGQIQRTAQTKNIIWIIRMTWVHNYSSNHMWDVSNVFGPTDPHHVLYTKLLLRL